jgi:hypothetical protein
LAQPREINPTRNGLEAGLPCGWELVLFLVTKHIRYAKRKGGSEDGEWQMVDGGMHEAGCVHEAESK